MFTITTATGKQFDSDYAVDNSIVGLAFVRIINEDRSTVESTFKNAAELPLDCFPEHTTLTGILDEGSGVKLILKKGVNV